MSSLPPRQARPDPAALRALRTRLNELHTPARHGVLAFGDPRIDGCLPGGGLPLGQLHELTAPGMETETGAVVAGFAACMLARLLDPRPVVWIAPGRTASIPPDLHPPGLLGYGLDPGRVILAHSRADAETLAAMETALGDGAASAVVGEVGRLSRLAARRLQLACLRHATTGLVLRRWPWGRKAADPGDGNAAVTRWRIAPALSQTAHRAPGPPRWQVSLTHARGGTTGIWIVEAGGTDAPHALRVVAGLADPAAAPDRRRHAG